ncbi:MULTISPECIES: YchF-related putative GTPase [unclassified Acidiplasma]|uniref:YchF-related putative GTPase n=1 Tax=unclassified Acidiplasma TaxID=2641301 RepID=UPI0005DF51A8|nr:MULTISPECIES: YchF-related putative GTPase [unclassified Acidiplasma]KJE49389.1 translation-associated GTPase [Acidiplasma sp. MBA-1]WMT54662.1 MAG: YchF-related putative GTPase [Acidiplasma sp.]
MLKIGLIGKPNAGKSTLFSAITLSDVDIANYPFTTIKPNVGISYITDECPERYIGAKCNPREGKCINGIRYIPVEIIDVPGLIEGASEGKGMGNEFLDNIRDADIIINLYDVNGDEDSGDYKININMVRNEIMLWLKERIYRDWQKFARKEDADTSERLIEKILKKVASFGIKEKDLFYIMSKDSFPERLIDWKPVDVERFCNDILTYVKPIFNIGNKIDLLDSDSIEKIKKDLNNNFLISAEYEFILAKAFKNGYINNNSIDFNYTNKSGEEQKIALEKIRMFYKNNGIRTFTDIITDIIKGLGYIVVYPVADENKWTDKNGNILPDAYIVKDGTTALDLAFLVHTDIGKNFIRAINGKTKRVIGKDYKLLNNDVVRIVSNLR